MRKTCAIIAHGGAGGVKYPQRRKAGLIEAINIGYGILTQDGSSLDAVEKAVMILEDTTVFNAGTGSQFNLKGEVEMDASIVTSELNFGAVTAIKGVKNPIRVARLVMERTDHLLLCGKGAAKFARLMGIKHYNPKTKERERVWRKKRKSLKSPYMRKLKDLAELYGTVGAVAIDIHGLISVATSTGGMLMKIPGRVGDTPLIGAGTYADRNGGVSATGHGEEIIRHMIAFRAVSLMARYPAQTAEKKLIDYSTKHNCQCGFVGIDKKGRLLCNYTTRAMSWAYIKQGKMRFFEH